MRLAVLARAPGSSAAVTLPLGENGYRVVASEHDAGDRKLLIVAGQSLRNEHESFEDLLTGFAIAVPLLLILAAAAGYFFAWRSLLPVSAMSRRASEISATNLHDRLPVKNREDELGQLAGIINDLLDRLDRAFAQQRRFMTDASHELRTPVAVVRNEAEIALNRDRSPEEYREALGVVRGEGVRLTRIVNDLFLLARVDTGEQPVLPVELYLDELVAEVVRSLQSLANARGTSLTCKVANEAAYRGDYDLLQRLLGNLIENAIKYAPPGGRVHASLSRSASGYDIRVTDNGVGIPKEAQPHIFDRFYRADEARSRTGLAETGGAGLGLAIARWAALAHEGTLELLRSDSTGTEFRLELRWKPGG